MAGVMDPFQFLAAGISGLNPFPEVEPLIGIQCCLNDFEPLGRFRVTLASLMELILIIDEKSKALCFGCFFHCVIPNRRNPPRMPRISRISASCNSWNSWLSFLLPALN